MLFILTQPLFIGKLLLTVLFYTVCNAVCHCLLNERDDDDDAGMDHIDGPKTTRLESESEFQHRALARC